MLADLINGIFYSHRKPCILERFSNECRETKTKVITLTSHNRNTKQRTNQKLNQTQVAYKYWAWSAAKRVRVTINFGFTSDWLRKWCELFYPIKEQSKPKLKQTQHYSVATLIWKLLYHHFTSIADEVNAFWTLCSIPRKRSLETAKTMTRHSFVVCSSNMSHN